MSTPVQDAFEKGKAWYQSKTIIGILIAAVSTVVKAFLPDVDIQGATDEVLNADQVAMSADQVVASVVQLIGFVTALYGRIVAKLGIK